MSSTRMAVGRRPAPPDDGTLLIDDWAWISLNLTNLTAAASGRADASQYTVDYSASGNYAGAPRQLAVEEVYNSDLSLRSSVVLSDTSTPGTSAPSSTGPAVSGPLRQPLPFPTQLAPLRRRRRPSRQPLQVRPASSFLRLPRRRRLSQPF